MNLVEESFKYKEEKNKKKSLKIILAAIIFIIIIITIIASYLFYLQSKQLKVMINQNINLDFKNIVLYENGEMYLPIKDVAKYLEYDSYNGEYSEKSEITTKCYVQNENEVANYELSSKRIYKILTNSNDGNYEYVDIEKPIISKNGTLYSTVEGIEKGFNISFDYNEEKNLITIWTLPGLVNYYTTKVNEWNYILDEDNFINEKAILNNFLIVKKSGNEKKYGVIDLEGNQVLDCKYDNITYLPNTNEFLITADGKVGIISSNRRTKVSPIYDEIKLIDKDAGLYLAKKDKKYGVINLQGDIVIHLDYDEIGVDLSKFKENNIKSKYILANKFIPIKKDKNWGMYDLSGNLVVDFNYDEIGYLSTSDKNVYNLLIIPDYNMIVVGREKKYTLITASGQDIFNNPIADGIYMTINGGKKAYYISVGDNTFDAIEVLKRLDVTSNSSRPDTDTNNNNNNNENTEENREDNNGENQNNEETGNNEEEENNDENINNDNNNQEETQENGEE